MAAMELKAVRAKHGDALILTTADATVLIDGGPPGVFKRFLKDHIEALDEGGEEPPEIDLLMVSHIDEDHIAGILDLTSNIIDAEEEDARQPVRIRRAWFNSFADVIAKEMGTTPQRESASAASLASAYEELGLDVGSSADSALVLSSVSQGRNLRRDLEALSIDVNARFKDRLVLAENATSPWICGDLELKVIGPTRKELNALRDEWAKQLPEILKKEAKREARTAAAEALDTSVFNLSSIVVIAESRGKRMLLTGDARGDMILEWLETAGFPGGKAHFDLIKLPHHGSDRNIPSEFCRKVTADHYVVSGDGKHGNPEPTMFGTLFRARGDAPYKIHMTYSPDELKAHKEYKKHGKGAKLDAVLDAEPWRRSKLSFPQAAETALTVLL